MEPLLISACLLGANCKYSGGNNALPPEKLAALRERYHLIPVCPEVAGGLPVPREPSERQGDRVVSRLPSASAAGKPCSRSAAPPAEMEKYTMAALRAVWSPDMG